MFFCGMKAQNQPLLLLVLRITCFAIFFGRFYEHFFFNPPYREFFWNPKLMLGVADFLGYSWNQWMSSAVVDQGIQWFIKSIGLVFLVAAVSSLFAKKEHKWLSKLPILGFVFMLPYLWLHYFGHTNNLALVFEFSAQLSIPFLLHYSLNRGINKQLIFSMKLVIALTFVAHGIYAVGIAPVPQKFIAMVIKTIEMSNASAKEVLFIAGILDFAVAIGLFIPRLLRLSLAYMLIWGFLTAFARIHSNFYEYDAWRSIHQWTWQFLIRTPHYSIPLVLLLSLSPVRKSRLNDSENQDWLFI